MATVNGPSGGDDEEDHDRGPESKAGKLEQAPAQRAPYLERTVRVTFNAGPPWQHHPQNAEGDQNAANQQRNEFIPNEFIQCEEHLSRAAQAQSWNVNAASCAGQTHREGHRRSD